MAKKKKKKGDKTPYVHIDIMPEQEQFPDARIQPGVPGSPQAQGQMPNVISGAQRANDPRKRGEGFDRYPSEVVSASNDGLSKKKVGEQGSFDVDEESDVAPFVIPVFRKSGIPHNMPGVRPMPNGPYGTGQFPPVGGGMPNGNPMQNLAQIQQNLLNHHNAAQQQAHQHSMQQPMGQPIQNGMGPMGQQPAQAAQQAAAQQAAAEALAQQQAAHEAAVEAAAKQKAAQEAATRQAAMRQAAMGQHAHAQMQPSIPQATPQETSQFVPTGNQAVMHQQAQHTAGMQPQQVVSAHDMQPSSGIAQHPHGAQPQGVSSNQQRPMQAVVNTAAAGHSQVRNAPAQAAVHSAAQTVPLSQQAMHSSIGQHPSGAVGVQQPVPTPQGSPYRPASGASRPMQPNAQMQVAQVDNMPSAVTSGHNYQPSQSQAPVSGKPAGASSPAHPSQSDSRDASSSENAGDSPFDAKAIEDSTMFDEPPVSIEEGMRKSTSGHKMRIRVVVIVVILLILIGAAVVVYPLLSEQGVVPRISIETATVQVTPQGSSSSAASADGSGAGASNTVVTPESPSGGDLSGTVVYEYTANTASGVEYKVEETVTFQSNGDCQSSTMNMTFPDEASAKTFSDILERDYGTSFKLDSLNGNNAVVTIDNSGLHLTRDEYENALRYSVSDLIVTK